MPSTVPLGLLLSTVLLAGALPVTSGAQVPGRCAAAKQRCVGRAVEKELGCHARATRAGLDPAADPQTLRCRQRAAARLMACVEKIEGRQQPAQPETLCATEGDAAVLAERAHAFVLAQVIALQPGFVPQPRFEDTGLTVIDHLTGREWEKKDGADGVPGLGTPDPENPHDVDNRYTLAAVPEGRARDGTAFTVFLSELNACGSLDGEGAGGGFAGRCDWRMPQIEELRTILLEPFPCGTSPCIDPVFGPTAASFTWSATGSIRVGGFAWFAHFDDAVVDHDWGDGDYYVRAVRTAW